jgi:hypothetical protein
VTFDGGAVQRGARREVAGEERGVDDDAGHDAGRPQPDDRPVVPGDAPAAGLPAVVLLALVAEPGPRRGRLRQDQVLLGRERGVVGGDDRAAERAGGQVGQAGEVRHRLTLACRG